MLNTDFWRCAHACACDMTVEDVQIYQSLQTTSAIAMAIEMVSRRLWERSSREELEQARRELVNDPPRVIAPHGYECGCGECLDNMEQGFIS